MTDEQLRAEYKRLIAAQRAGTFTGADAAHMLAVCAELGSRGYRLTENEEDWERVETEG